LLENIYEIVRELEELFPGRRFTPDGHMVGSIGEVLAEREYDIKLLPSNAKDHDAKTEDGRLVQIRTTQGNSAPLKKLPDYLIVQKLNPDATVDEIYNGPGHQAWSITKTLKADNEGHFNISLGRYRKADKAIPEDQRIKRRGT